MTFQPGQSGNPSGWQGGRQRHHREIFDEIKKLGHRDALITLSTIQHETQDESLKIAAAAALAPYAHPKLQSLPCPVFIASPVDLPPPTSIEQAKENVAKLISHLAKGEIDHASYDRLIAGNVAMINALLGQDKLAVAQGGDTGDHVIRIEGGLPVMPGHEGLIMPPREHINGSSNGYTALPEPSTLNVSTIDGIHTAESSPPSESIQPTETGGHQCAPATNGSVPTDGAV